MPRALARVSQRAGEIVERLRIARLEDEQEQRDS
jgi:hypothetical protein